MLPLITLLPVVVVVVVEAGSVHGTVTVFENAPVPSMMDSTVTYAVPGFIS
jgi:hypothetical protein